METKTQTPELYYNSADDPLGQFMAISGDEIHFPYENMEAELRAQAIRYIGRQVLPTVGRIGLSVGRTAIAIGRHVVESNR